MLRTSLDYGPFMSRLSTALLLVGVALANGCGYTGGPAAGDWEALCESASCEPGRCVVTSEGPQCLCPSGFVSIGVECRNSTDASACEPNPCAGTGRELCVQLAGETSCQCGNGLIDRGGHCLQPEPCSLNSCVGARSECIVVDEEPQCTCPAGYRSEGDDGCSQLPVYRCEDAHAGDAFEPDECPRDASSLETTDVEVTHTLSPNRDVDWVRVETLPLHIYEVRVNAEDETPIVLDVFDADGLTPVGSDHSRGSDLKAVFHAGGSGGARYLRVQAVSALARPTYDIAVRDTGVDDFPNQQAEARPLTLPATVSGNWQYSGDVEWFAIDAPAGMKTRISVDGTAAGVAQLELYRADGSLLLSRSDIVASTSVTPLADQRVFLRVLPVPLSSQGVFSMEVKTVGADDHPDNPEEAQPILPSANSVSVMIEDSEDSDVLVWSARATHIYELACIRSVTGVRPDGRMIIQDEESRILGHVVAAEPQLRIEAPEDGLLVARIGLASRPGSHAFNCLLTDLGPDDYGDNYATATLVSLSSTPVPGRFELPGDLDVITIGTPVLHSVYEISCSAPWSSTCLLRGWLSRLISAAPRKLVFKSDGVTPAIVEISEGPSNPGTYDWSFRYLGLDVPGETLASALAIAADGIRYPTALEYEGDRDVFSFDPTPDHIYELKCVAAWSGCRASILSPGGSYAGPYGAYDTMVVEIPSGSPWYGEIRQSSPGYPLDYSWSVTDRGVDDFGDGLVDASPFKPPQIQGRFEFGQDVDSFRTLLDQNEIFRFTASAPAAASTGGLVLTVYDPTGTRMSYVRGDGAGLQVKAPVKGDYVVTLALTGNRPPATTLPYVLNAQFIGFDDHGNDVTTATPISPSLEGSGALEYFDDVDAFSMTAIAGHVYEFELASACACSHLLLRDAQGVLIPTERDGSAPPRARLAFEAAATGLVAFEVVANNVQLTAPYTWKVIDRGLDDRPDTWDSVGSTIPLETEVPGVLETPRDVDVFSFDASLGKIYAISSFPEAGTGAAGAMLVVYDASGTVLSTRWDRTWVEAERSGLLYVAVSAHSGRGYRIHIHEVGFDDHGDSFGEATQVTGLPHHFAVTIEQPGDLDYFGILLSAGQTYQLRSTSNTHVTVHGPRGESLFAGHLHYYWPRQFVAPSTGIHYLGLSTDWPRTADVDLSQ